MTMRSTAIPKVLCIFLLLSVISVVQAQEVTYSVGDASEAMGVGTIEKKEHIVQKGQLAVTIAQEYGLNLNDLRQFNPDKDLARLQIGDRLVVGEAIIEPVKDRPDKMALIAAAEQQIPTPVKQEVGILTTVVSMVLKLGVVLALAYGTVLVLKLLSSRRESLPRLRQEMKVGDTVRLSSTNSLHLINVRGKTLLVGCSSGQVNLLREFEDEEEVKDEVAEVPARSFSEYLAKYSSAAGENGAMGRVAGLLRDCATHLKNGRENSRTNGRRNIRVNRNR